ncbi:hypothetical protein ACI8AC_02245 [Geodermatophilus sp. SYSU D00758]
MTDAFGPPGNDAPDRSAARLLRPKRRSADAEAQTAIARPGAPDGRSPHPAQGARDGARPFLDGPALPHDEAGAVVGGEPTHPDGDAVRPAGVAAALPVPAPPLDDRVPEDTRSTDEGRTPPVDPTAPGATTSRWAHVRTLVPALSWRTIAVAVAVIVVAVWVGRGVIGNSGGETVPTAGSGDTQAEVPDRENRQRQPVTIDGQRIAPAGSVITLNPAVAQPGASITVSGFGFDPGSTVDLVLSAAGAAEGEGVGSAEADEDGGFSTQLALPERLAPGNLEVTAKQRDSDITATAEAVATAGTGSVELSETTGKPGDVIAVSARGFEPGETINVYWGRVTGEPSATLTADESGGVGEASVRVGTGTVGDGTLVLVGETSGTAATAAFHLTGLYPTVAAEPYAVKARQAVTLSGEGFAPDEQVLIYINASSGSPLMTTQADDQGDFGGVGFEVPYGLKGSNSLVMIGEQSRASASSGFEVLPYTPSAQPSTYGGAPGTTFSFFAEGFGPDEVVLVYLGRGQGNPGELVTAFQVDDQGAAGAGGSFQVDGSDQGTLTFGLVGRDSGSETTAEFQVSAPAGPVGDVPPREEYTLPPELAEEPGESRADQPAEGAPPAPAPPPEGAPPAPAPPPEGAPPAPAPPPEGAPPAPAPPPEGAPPAPAPPPEGG